MEIKEIVSIVKSINEFAETIKTNKTKFSDVLLLTKLDSTISDDISTLMSWLSVQQPVQTIVAEEDNEPWLSVDPEAEWIKNNIDNLMVSSSGLFWSLAENSLMKPRFVGGDLRIDFPNGDAKRAAVIIAKTFRLWSYDRNSDECVIWYKDGDHRNIAINNLVWKKRSECVANNSAWTLLIEDICRRIIEHNCDIEKILSCYEGSDPAVDKTLIKRILRKEKYSDISDRFFVLSGDTIVPREDIITNEDEAAEITHTSIGYDIAAFLMTTGDKVIARQLLVDKIKEKQILSEDEKKMMVFSTIEQIGGKKVPSSRIISKTMNDIYGVAMPFDIIEQIQNNDNGGDIAKIYSK